jgi:hypothetical protein
MNHDDSGTSELPIHNPANLSNDLHSNGDVPERKYPYPRDFTNNAKKIRVPILSGPPPIFNFFLHHFLRESAAWQNNTRVAQTSSDLLVCSMV